MTPAQITALVESATTQAMELRDAADLIEGLRGRGPVAPEDLRDHAAAIVSRALETVRADERRREVER